MTTRRADRCRCHTSCNATSTSTSSTTRAATRSTERRSWHPAGASRSAAEAIKVRVDQARPPCRRPGTLGEFLATTWIDSKPLITHASRRRYQWMLEKNIAPRIGDIALDQIRPEDLDALSQHLLRHGGRYKTGLAAKTVLEIHRTISNALNLAVDRRLFDTNPATQARPPRPDRRSTVPQSGTPCSSPYSLPTPSPNGSTRRCTSPRTPASAAANSLGCNGATSTQPTRPCQSPGLDRSPPVARLNRR